MAMISNYKLLIRVLFGKVFNACELNMLVLEIRFFPGVFVGKSWVIKVFTEYHSPMFHILLAKDNHDSPFSFVLQNVRN